MNLRQGGARAVALASHLCRHFHTVHELSPTRSPSIPRSGNVARHELFRELRRPSHVLLAHTAAFVKYRVQIEVPYLSIGAVFNNNTLFITPSPMTLIQRSREHKAENMEVMKEDSGKSLRPVRSRRYTRRSLVAGQRPQKRLFTPEIKRYLKDWLVRRRDNPYPNREEKKYLSRETGLTYIQICNWFANWRRKLKNVNADRNQQTWGHLIRTYNDRAQGNVEQFSICSDDSIWSEAEPISPEHEPLDSETRYDSPESRSECRHDDTDTSSTSVEKCESFNNNSNEVDHRKNSHETSKSITSPLLLSKWLESAARFQPSESNYSWWGEGRRRKVEAKVQRMTLHTLRHDRDEVEAAVALTALASASSRLTAP